MKKVKYLVVYSSYVGRYYNGQHTIIYDTYEKMINGIKENDKEWSQLEPQKVYVIKEELDIKELLKEEK